MTPSSHPSPASADAAQGQHVDALGNALQVGDVLEYNFFTGEKVTITRLLSNSRFVFTRPEAYGTTEHMDFCMCFIRVATAVAQAQASAAACTEQKKPKHDIDQLMDEVFFSGRTPRSPQYRAGVRAVLAFKLEKTPIDMPYRVGTPEADAYFAGQTEGYSINRRELGLVGGIAA